MVVHTIGYVSFPFLLMVAVIFWCIYRHENRIRKEKEEEHRKKQEENLKISSQISKEREEQEKQREEKAEEYAKSLETVIVQLTDEEVKKKKFCQEKSGNIIISNNAIYILYQILKMSDKKTEKQEILELLGDRDEDKHYAALTMDPDDQERMAYCKDWLGVGEEEVYAIGIEYYRQYLTQ